MISSHSKPEHSRPELSRPIALTSPDLDACTLALMNPFKKLLDALRPKEPSPEDLEADVEAKRLADRNLDARLSQRQGSGAENYQSGRGTM
jgi:hypothetical protein